MGYFDLLFTFLALLFINNTEDILYSKEKHRAVNFCCWMSFIRGQTWLWSGIDKTDLPLRYAIHGVDSCSFATFRSLRFVTAGSVDAVK